MIHPVSPYCPLVTTQGSSGQTRNRIGIRGDGTIMEQTARPPMADAGRWCTFPVDIVLFELVLLALPQGRPSFGRLWIAAETSWRHLRSGPSCGVFHSQRRAFICGPTWLEGSPKHHPPQYSFPLTHLCC